MKKIDSTQKLFERKTHLLDATDETLGRFATKIARLLMGKHKVSWKPHLDIGDIIEVKNVKRLHFSGNKLELKEYIHHTNHPGGLKITLLKDVLAKKPEMVLQHAVWNMLPKNLLRDKRMKRLRFVKSDK